MSGGIFLFKFMASEDLVVVLSSRPWVYGKHIFYLCHWKSGVDPVVDLNKSAPV